MNPKSKQQRVRFVIVGVANTCIDFSIFLTLSALGVPAVAANFVATSLALSFSFVANKKYTFSVHTGNAKKQLVLFLLVTLFGLWVLQPAMIVLGTWLLNDFRVSYITALLLSKIAATILTLLWNYTLYSRVVFKATEAGA